MSDVRNEKYEMMRRKSKELIEKEYSIEVPNSTLTLNIQEPCQNQRHLTPLKHRLKPSSPQTPLPPLPKNQASGAKKLVSSSA